MPDYIPADSPPIVPYLAVDDADSAIEFYKAAFDATLDGEPMRMPDGTIGHATLRVGDAVFMLSDAFPDMGVNSPATLGGTPVSVMVYVEDCDAMTRKAEEAGATIDMPPTDQFWGNRDSRLTDPFGHRWNLATQVEVVTPEMMSERISDWEQQGQG